MADESRMSRRELIKRAGLGAGGLAISGAAVPNVLAARRIARADTNIKIGFVSPLTGPAAGFGEPDPYVLGLANKALAKGLTIGGNRLHGAGDRQGRAVDAERAPPRPRTT